jgi:hypothetical protein
MITFSNLSMELIVSRGFRLMVRFSRLPIGTARHTKIQSSCMLFIFIHSWCLIHSLDHCGITGHGADRLAWFPIDGLFFFTTSNWRSETYENTVFRNALYFYSQQVLDPFFGLLWYYRTSLLVGDKKSEMELRRSLSICATFWTVID